jgi:hypothetical protein
MGNRPENLIKFVCPFCGQSISSGPEVVGQVVDCPSCSQSFQVSVFEPETLPRSGHPSRNRSPRPKKSRNPSWIWPVCGGLAATIVLGAVFYLSGVLGGKEPRGGEPASGAEPTTDSTKGNSSAESSGGSSVPQYSQTPEPLSRFLENPHWQAFLSNEPRQVHFIDEAPEWANVAPEVALGLFPKEITPELLSFHQGLDFCQSVRGKSESVSAEMWEKWFSHLGIEKMDEFESRDLITSEKSAYERILMSLEDGTPYDVITDQIYQIGEYDFDDSAFPLDHRQFFFPDDVSENRLWPPSGPPLSGGVFVTEENARELRDRDVKFICIREVITMEWNTGWWLEGKKTSRSLNNMKNDQFVSPDEWTYDEGKLRKKNQPEGSTHDDFRNSFLTSLEEFHGLYAANVTPFYSVFSTMSLGKQPDAHDYNQEILRMHQRRDAYAVGLVRHGADRTLQDRLTLIEASDEFQELVESYMDSARIGFAFVGADTPQASLENLLKFLEVHRSVYTKHKVILQELGVSGTQN